MGKSSGMGAAETAFICNNIHLLHFLLNTGVRGIHEETFSFHGRVLWVGKALSGLLQCARYPTIAEFSGHYNTPDIQACIFTSPSVRMGFKIDRMGPQYIHKLSSSTSDHLPATNLHTPSPTPHPPLPPPSPSPTASPPILPTTSSNPPVVVVVGSASRAPTYASATRLQAAYCRLRSPHTVLALRRFVEICKVFWIRDGDRKRG